MRVCPVSFRHRRYFAHCPVLPFTRRTGTIGSVKMLKIDLEIKIIDLQNEITHLNLLNESLECELAKVEEREERAEGTYARNLLISTLVQITMFIGVIVFFR